MKSILSELDKIYLDHKRKYSNRKMNYKELRELLEIKTSSQK
jgi:hypothetical protein